MADPVASGQYTKKQNAVLLSLQAEGTDSSPQLCEKYAWLATYQSAGRRGLEGYLGTPKEIDFDEVCRIIHDFKAKAATLLLKRMGREVSEIWYDPVNFEGTRVLLLEWTHGNSQYLRDVDIPIFLSSSPQETLEFRRFRNRDHGCNSPFTEMVLDIEQRMLLSQEATAKLIVGKTGEIL